MTDALTDEELDQRIARLTSRREYGEYRYYQPLSDAVDDYEHWATTPQQRVYIGLEVFDNVMRGTAPGEMTQLVGYAQSGKTIMLTNMMLNNNHRPFAWFTPDETRVLVLIRLACVLHNVSAWTIEKGLQDGNVEVRKMLDETVEHFPLLGVYEEGMNVAAMERAMIEQEKATGRRPEAIIFDYASLLDHEGMDVRGKLTALKYFGKNMGLPLFVVQQTSRHTGKDGERIDLASGEYGGEQQATHIIGVRRKYQYYDALLKEIDKKMANPNTGQLAYKDLQDARYLVVEELETHRNTVTISVVKNKRPPGNLVDEVDFSIDRDTGRLNEYTPMYRQTVAPTLKVVSNKQMVFGNGGD